MADNELDSMKVSFGADFSDLNSASSGVKDIFDEIAASAEESSSVISESMTAAGESFASLGEEGSGYMLQIIDLLGDIANNTYDTNQAIEGMRSAVTGAVEDSTVAIEELSSQFGELSVSATSSAEAMAEASSSAENAGSGGFGGLFNQIGFGIMNLQMMGNMAMQLGSALLGPAVSAETVTTALTTLDGSAKAAGQEMQNLNAFAAKTPFKTLDIDQAAEELQGFGINANNVIPEITAIGDALGSVGRDTPAEMDSVVQIFGKISTEGKVTQMTMNELAVHGINGWQALADATGKTIPQVKDMVAKGLLPANDAINDLTKGIEMNPLYAGGMSKAAGTFTGLLSTLQSNFQQVLASFGSPIIKALEPELNKLGTLFSSPAFQTFAGSVGQGIVDVFKQIGNVVGPLTGDLAPVGSAIEKVAGSLGGLSKNSAVSGFLSSMQTGFQAVSKIVGGQLSSDFQTFSNTAQSLGKWWQTTMEPTIEKAMPGFENLGNTIATVVVPALAQIWTQGQKLMNDVMPPLTKAFETIAPIVVQVGGFLANNLGQALKFLTPFVVQAAQQVEQFGEAIITRVTPFVTQMYNSIKTFLDWIKPYWPSIWDTIKTVLTSTWDTIKGVIQIAWSVVSGIIKVGLDLLSGNWKGAWDDIKNMFSGVWDGIKSIAAGVWDLVKKPIMDGINAFKADWSNDWNAIKTTFSNIWDGIKNAASNAWGGVTSAIKGGINDVIGAINTFIRSLDSIQIHIPSVGVGPVHTPSFDWNGVGIPTIPKLYTGGFVAPGGVAIAGDRGPELVFGGASGAHVLSNAQSMAALSGAQSVIHNHNHIYIDSQEITDIIGPRIVQRWLNHGPIKTLRSA